MGTRDYGIDVGVVKSLAGEIAAVRSSGVDVAIVVGAGNFYRGLAAAAEGWSGRPPTTRACSRRC